MTSVLYDVPGPRARRRNLIGTVVGGLVLLALAALVVNQLRVNGIFEIRRWQIFWDPPPPFPDSAQDVWRFLLVQGLGATLRAAGIAAIFAMLLGFVLAVWRMAPQRWVQIPAITVIEFFRGLPVVLLMLFSALALGLSIFQAVVLGLVIYNAAIIGEILRAGIVSLPKGQSEAAYAIGMTHWQTLLLILLPQAVRRMLPSLVSQLVVLLKDTSLGFIVGYTELLRSVQNLRDYFGNAFLFSLFFVGAAIYIAVNFSISRLAVWLERRGSKKAAGGVAPIETDVDGQLDPNLGRTQQSRGGPL
jgi:glutamate transport system permease protein